jgi:hypothetical protein
MTTARALALLAFSLAILQAPAPHAAAEGALAIGATGDVARDGYAYGNAVNAVTREAAAQRALDNCERYQGAPKAVAQCQVVATFSRQCYAIAFDPDPGTPGAGWAIGPTLAAARDRALAACERVAGPGRQGRCKVDSALCDQNNSGIDNR